MTDTVDDMLLWTTDIVCGKVGVSKDTWKKWKASGATLRPHCSKGKWDFYLVDEVRAWTAAGMPGGAKWEEMKEAAAFTVARKPGRAS